MKLAVLVLIASTTAPVESLRLRRGAAAEIEPQEAAEEPEAAIAIVDGDSDRGEGRELLATWCPSTTPTLWHPNYSVAWIDSGCIQTRDCNSPGYATQLECCKGQYGGQTSGACLAGLPAPPTNAPTNAAGAGGKWYADYGTSWPAAGCKITTPYPIYATTFFDTQLECCKGQYGGQTSGACLAGLPAPPTNAPTNAAGAAAAKWYADYATPWPSAGCKSETPYPIYATYFYDSELACCKGAYGGQDSGACLGGLPNPPTKVPTALPTLKPTSAAGAGGQWYADYGTVWSIAGCKNTLPLPIYTIVTYSNQLECCKAAYGGQTSNACVQGLPNPPTKAPTAQPTSKPTATPTAKPTSKPTATPTAKPTSTPTSAPTTSKPTTSKPV
jgi:hypothetical protein